MATDKENKESGGQHHGKSGSHDRIELRSEKVRDILGSEPNVLVRWGIAIVTVVFLLLILAVLSMDYPCGNGESIFGHIFLT